MLRIHPVRLPEDARAWREVICESLKEAGFPNPKIPLSVLRRLPDRLKETDSLDLTVVQAPDESVVLDIGLPAPLSAAVDIGSTNIDAWLVDPASGQVLASRTALNPQSLLSEDILDRVLHSHTRMDELQEPLTQAVMTVLEELCQATKRQPTDICLIAGAGNTAMTHLFLGVEATSLPIVPNTPVFHWPGLLRARELGLFVHPEALLYLFPNVGAFVGGDIVADLLALGLHQSESVSVLVDVGTNAEVLVGNRNWILAGAGAAGPALEGGIAGLAGRAMPGAVEQCFYQERERVFSWTTIGDVPPTHFCGSGLIDLVRELYRSGLIDGRGHFREERCTLAESPDGERAIEVVGPEATGTGKGLQISERDLDNFIRSKAGMYALVRTLLVRLGLNPSDVTQVHICGAFGNRLDPEELAFLGMFPCLPNARFRGTEDATLQGIHSLLCNAERFSEISEIMDKVTYMDMNTDPIFMKEFAGARFIPHTHAGPDQL